MKVIVGYDDPFEYAVHVVEPRVIAGETLCGIGTWPGIGYSAQQFVNHGRDVVGREWFP